MGENENITPKCTFTHKYYNYETIKTETFECDQLPIGDKGLCLFHYDEYLKDKIHPENKENIIRRLNRRIENSINHTWPLKCIGYYLPDIKINKRFTQSVYFNHCRFQKAFFFDAKFSGRVSFLNAEFSDKLSSPMLHSQVKHYFS